MSSSCTTGPHGVRVSDTVPCLSAILTLIYRIDNFKSILNTQFSARYAETAATSDSSVVLNDAPHVGRLAIATPGSAELKSRWT